ncbi:hypothetical protein ABT275_42185, partial [Streptomyces sp. NPDC001185]
VLFGSALGGQGVAHLVESALRLIPPAPVTEGTEPRGTVFAVRPGPSGERTAYLRLYGEVARRQHLTFLRREADGRTTEVSGRVTLLDVVGGGGSLTAGNIAALTVPAGLHVGDRFGELADRATQFVPPTLETLVRARHPEQVARLRSTLLALADQDPLIHARPADSGATALLLYGEVQMGVLAATLAQDFGVEADFRAGRVRFLERPRGRGEAYAEMPWREHTRYWATPWGGSCGDDGDRLDPAGRPGGLEGRHHGKVELTAMVDVATRPITVAVLRPSERSRGRVRTAGPQRHPGGDAARLVTGYANVPVGAAAHRRLLTLDGIRHETTGRTSGERKHRQDACECLRSRQWVSSPSPCSSSRPGLHG